MCHGVNFTVAQKLELISKVESGVLFVILLFSDISIRAPTQGTYRPVICHLVLSFIVCLYLV